MFKSNSRKSQLGFTLVELLVVIGIIAVLISFLMPSLTRARGQAIRVQCMSNLRQFGLSATMYCNDFKGVMPSPRRTPKRIMYPWFGAFDLKKRVDFEAGVLVDKDLHIATPWDAAGTRLLCPINPNRSDTWSIVMTYGGGSNWFMPTTTKDSANVLWAGDYKGQYAEGAGIDGGESSLQGEHLNGPYAAPLMWFGHMGTATFLMADGHCEFRKQNDTPVMADKNAAGVAGAAFRAPGYTKFILSMKSKVGT